MGEGTKIEWADHTFNPWVGCTKVSPGCAHCYAEGWAKRSGQVGWGPNEARRRTSAANWRQPLRWEKAARIQQDAWEHGVEMHQGDESACIAAGYIKPTRPKVFCASLADVFDDHTSIDPQWRADLWRLIKATPNLTRILVTKRIGNATAMLPDDWGDGYPNVWVLITVTSQPEADRDIPTLLATPAAKRGLSMEPLLGPVDLTAEYLTVKLGSYPFACIPRRDRTTLLDLLDLVIVGGESGPHAPADASGFGAEPAGPVRWRLGAVLFQAMGRIPGWRVC